MKDRKLGNIYDEKYKLYDNINFHLVSFVDPGKKVLDVGCNTGKLGEYLQRHKGCQVFGVDISTEAIMEAKGRLERAEAMDVESDDFPFPQERFDIIIFGDILEHLKFPVQSLIRFAKYLDNNGGIVASSPNVANVLIRLKLLMGKWEYQNSGIMDNSHLRFFTYKSMLDMFEQASLEVVQHDWIAGRYVFIDNPFWSKVWETVARLFPTLLATQFIFLTRPYENRMRF